MFCKKCLKELTTDNIYSSDSRYYGPFKKENIRSKGIFIAWPLSDFGVETW